MSDVLLLLVPVLAVVVLFQVAKRFVPGVETLSGIAKQLIVVLLVVAISIFLKRREIGQFHDLQALGIQALIGLVQGLASLGVHSAKKQVSQSLFE